MALPLPQPEPTRPLRVELTLAHRYVCTLDVPGDQLTIGRGAWNQLTLKHPDVDLAHVRFFVGGGRLWLQPIGRRTSWNGRILHEIVEARVGDAFEIGPYQALICAPVVEEDHDDEDTALTDVPTSDPTVILRIPPPSFFDRVQGAIRKVLLGGGTSPPAR